MKSNLPELVLVIMSAIVFATSCSDSDDDSPAVKDTNENENTDTGTGLDTNTEAASLSHTTDIQPIWNTNCSPCHIQDTAENLSLVDGYSALVNVPSIGSGLDLVEPQDTSLSYLWHKLNDTQNTVDGKGSSMPLGGTLSQDNLDTIEAWITEGAAP